MPRGDCSAKVTIIGSPTPMAPVNAPKKGLPIATGNGFRARKNFSTAPPAGFHSPFSLGKSESRSSKEPSGSPFQKIFMDSGIKRTQCNNAKPRSFSSEELLRYRRGRGPKDFNLPVSRRHGQFLAIRTENKLAAYPIRLAPRGHCFEGKNFLPGRDMPELDSPIPMYGGRPAAVGSEGNTVRVAADIQNMNLLSSPGIPDLDLVFGEGSQKFAVTGEGEGADVATAADFDLLLIARNLSLVATT